MIHKKTGKIISLSIGWSVFSFFLDIVGRWASFVPDRQKPAWFLARFVGVVPVIEESVTAGPEAEPAVVAESVAAVAAVLAWLP